MYYIFTNHFHIHQSCWVYVGLVLLFYLVLNSVLTSHVKIFCSVDTINFSWTLCGLHFASGFICHILLVDYTIHDSYNLWTLGSKGSRTSLTIRSRVSAGYSSTSCSRRGNLSLASSELSFSAFSIIFTTCPGKDCSLELIARIKQQRCCYKYINLHCNPLPACMESQKRHYKSCETLVFMRAVRCCTGPQLSHPLLSVHSLSVFGHRSWPRSCRPPQYHVYAHAAGWRTALLLLPYVQHFATTPEPASVDLLPPEQKNNNHNHDPNWGKKNIWGTHASKWKQNDFSSSFFVNAIGKWQMSLKHRLNESVCTSIINLCTNCKHKNLDFRHWTGSYQNTISWEGRNFFVVSPV